MNENARRYMALRKQVQNLSTLNKKEISTNDLMRELDSLWVTMLKVRSLVIKQLRQGKTGEPAKFSPRDFYVLYCQLHNARGQGSLCSDCLSLFPDRGVPACPFCGAKVDDMAEVEKTDVVIDLAAARPPDWETDVKLSEVIKTPKKDIPPEIKPITKRDDIPGPKGPRKKKYHKHKAKLATSTVKHIRWTRRKEICANFPYTPKYLAGIKLMKTLRAICAAAADDYEDVRKYNRDQMIDYILAHQPDGPKDPGPPPYGNIADLEEI